MTIGIRMFTVETFNNTLPQLATLGGTEFRRSVMNAAVETFGISIASAATHYNFALKQAKATTPELVASLGRPEDKKGGRKPVHVVDVVKVKTGEVVAAGLSQAKAQAMVDLAAAKHKAKLEIRAVTKAEAAVVEAAVEGAGLGEHAADTAADAVAA